MLLPVRVVVVPARNQHHFLLHASLLSAILLLLALWHRSPLNVWTPQALALFAIAYVLTHALFLRKWGSTHEGRIIFLESIVSLIVTVELVELTGGLAGPIGWLTYLLVVWLTLQLETAIAAVVGLGLFAFFLPTSALFPLELLGNTVKEQPNLLIASIVRLGGLLFTIPLALYIGHRHVRKKLRDQKELAK